MTSVIPLFVKPNSKDPDIYGEILKAWTSLAEKDGLTGLFIIGIDENGNVPYSYASDGDAEKLIGCLEWVKARFFHELLRELE